ncbi:MAG: hypothetical protein M3071_05625 [Actinomycetota bacterium]|nr:hypothetical protein [Actinomycetota bacterium]
MGHAAHAASADVCDPGGFPVRIVVGGVGGDDLHDEGLERGVPPELGRVDLAVRHRHSAEIAGPAQATDRDLVLGVHHATSFTLKQSFQ